MAIDGWARNRHDGLVEAVFQGSPDSIAKMIERCRQGPSAAVVTDIAVREEVAGVLLGFIVRPTI